MGASRIELLTSSASKKRWVRLDVPRTWANGAIGLRTKGCARSLLSVEICQRRSTSVSLVDRLWTVISPVGSPVFVSECDRRGIPKVAVRAVTGHRSDAMLDGYSRPGELFRSSAGAWFHSESME